MCVICIKPAGVAAPTKDMLKAMSDNNPNGFGIATIGNDGGIHCYHTMDAKKFIKKGLKIADDSPAIYHCRIATHGSITEKNCHPFLSADGKWAFAHNGILSIQNDGDMTDSETFFRYIAEPLLKAGHQPYDDGTFDRMVESIIGSSKFAFMDSSGNIYRYGQYVTENGLFFSNTSYLSYDDMLTKYAWDRWGMFTDTPDGTADEVTDDGLYWQCYDELCAALTEDMLTDRKYSDSALMAYEYLHSKFKSLSVEDFEYAFEEARIAANEYISDAFTEDEYK